MKKILILPILFLLLFSSQSFAIDRSSFSFKNQTNILSEQVFPEIQKMIDDHQDLSKSAFVDIIDDTQKILIDHSASAQLLILNPPDIAVLKFENEDNIYYVLYLSIVLYDGEVSCPPLHTTISIKKRFLVKHIMKSKAEI
jgi:hypothetical protein